MARREISRRKCTTEMTSGETREWELVSFIDKKLALTYEICYKGYTTPVLCDEETAENAITFIEMIDAGMMG